jgi:hypothetical protein
MRLTSLTLKDFRGFTDATLNLDRPLTVLCGVNGAGKSSALLACLMVLSDILRGLGMQGSGDVWVHPPEDTDVRVGASKLSITSSFVSGTISERSGPTPFRPRNAGALSCHPVRARVVVRCTTWVSGSDFVSRR